VAAGVFAPGHLGELTWQVPFELADAVLEETRRRILITVGVGCILFGGIFFAANHSGHNVVATVTHEGPCSNGTCTVDVVYSAGGRQVTAVMYGVPSGEVYGSPWPRLNITYQPGYETDPTTNDMPDGIWIGFLAAGLAFVGWGAWLRLRRKRPQEELTVAAAGGAPAAAAAAAAKAPAVADQPAPDGPARISGRGPRWVADTSGAITIAERYPRWSAVIFTPLLAILPGVMVTQNSQTLLPRGRLLAAVAYLVIAAAVSIWGCSRAWRIGLRLGEDGATVRNYFRTYRIGWPEVRCFADGSVNGGQAGRLWALGLVLRDGRVVTASGTANGKRDARPETLTAIRQAAERYAVPAELTGTATSGDRGNHQPIPGFTPILAASRGCGAGMAGSGHCSCFGLTPPAANRAGERRRPRCGRLLPDHRRNGTTPQAGSGGPGSGSPPGWV